MKHKGFLPVLAAAVLTLALAACGGGGNSSSSGLAPAEGSEAAKESSVAAESSSSGLEASSAGASSEEQRHMMTVDETLEYFATLDPAALGLEKASMGEYQTYPNEKAVPVDGLPCMKVVVYSGTEEGNNVPEATFLVARDGTAIYRLEGDIAEKIEF